MITRRQFAASTPWLAASPLAPSGCSQETAAESFETVAERTWQKSAASSDASRVGDTTLAQELVRCATLAPSSHNTQCWKFAIAAEGRSITLLPDLARRCPAADPDDHHLFVSLGCATENLTQAALADGLKGEAQFGGAGDAAFVGQAADKAHWVEVAAVRTPFTTALGLTGQRPDLVVRFGRGPTLPRSLRRPVASVMV